MPHSNPDGSPGYHGTIAVNPGTTLAVNPGSALNIGGGQQIVGGQSVLTNQGVQNNQDNVPTFEEIKQLEEKIKNQMSGIDAPGSGVDGFEGEPIDRREAYIAAQADAGILGNLMKKRQEDLLRRTMLTDAKIYDFLAKENLLGYKGGLFGLDTGKIGGTIYPDFAYQYVDSDVEPSEFKSGMSDFKTEFDQINPITGERIRTVKAREGLTTPQYNQFISDLYDANPELYQETFPFASGQVAKPIFAKVAEGIMGIPGASELAQMGGDVVGAMISPLSGLFTGETAKTGFVNPKAPTGDSGIVEAVPEGMDMSIYGSFIGKPGPFTADFIDQDGDGVDDRFQSGPGKPKAPPYSPPKQPAETIIPSQKLTPFDINAFYASLPQYSQQGIMNPNLMSYYRNLGLFPGMAI